MLTSLTVAFDMQRAPPAQPTARFVFQAALASARTLTSTLAPVGTRFVQLTLLQAWPLTPLSLITVQVPVGFCPSKTDRGFCGRKAPLAVGGQVVPITVAASSSRVMLLKFWALPHT